MSPEVEALFDDANGDLALGDLEPAVEKYRRCTELAPDFADGWHALAMALMKVGRPTEAITAALRNTELLLWRQADRIGEFRRGRMLEVVGSPKPSTNPRWDPSFEVRDLRFID
jgi:tetratricopeptide (TPR) repeat protein